jgi:glycosyltransferase involved in cell wall biosynthesis
MRIVWFSWRDISHPLAGGAELISDELRRRLTADGHEVILITSVYAGAPSHEKVQDVEIYRTGGRLSVYMKSCFLYRKLGLSPDLVIDEMNTIPFGAAFYSDCRSILLTYKLAREVWFYQLPQPFSLLGYLIEPVYLYILSLKYKEVLTESESTRRDLARYGFKEKNVKIFRVSLATEPLDKLPPKTSSVVLSLGSIRPMKRTLDAVKAFEFAKTLSPNLKLIIAGDNNGPYAQKVIKYIKNSKFGNDIQILGRVTAHQKAKLMAEAAVILVTSIKEGWGLIVTEANSLGTPAVAYDVDGLRDSIIDGQTGCLVQSGNTVAMGQTLHRLLTDDVKYNAMRRQCWHNSKQYTLNNSYSDFSKHLAAN